MTSFYLNCNTRPKWLTRFIIDPDQQSEFLGNFYSRVWRMASLGNSSRIDRLLTVKTEIQKPQYNQ